MKKLESSLLNMVLVLTGVAVVMGGILAYVNHLTEGPINDQKAKALADGIKSVMCVDELKVEKTDTVRQTDSKGKELTFIIYQTQDAQGQDLGAAVESVTATAGSRRARRVTSSAKIPRSRLPSRKTEVRLMPSQPLPSLLAHSCSL